MTTLTTRQMFSLIKGAEHFCAQKSRFGIGEVGEVQSLLATKGFLINEDILMSVLSCEDYSEFIELSIKGSPALREFEKLQWVK